MFKALSRLLQRRRITETYQVWTRDERGRVFHYDIRIVPVHDRSRYLVRFIRTPMSNGNRLVQRRVLRPSEAQRLRWQCCA